MASRRSEADASEFAPPAPSVPLMNCPINASLGTLGRKWTLTILRDIAFSPGASFSSILKTNPGLLQRTLSLRLRQLHAEGLVERNASANGSRRGRYDLTAKGREIWPILAGLIQYGVKNHSEVVFADGRSRDIEDVFPASSELML